MATKKGAETAPKEDPAEPNAWQAYNLTPLSAADAPEYGKAPART